MRLTLEQYHRMGETGILTPDDRVELLDGMLVTKPMKKSPHVASSQKVRRALDGLPSGTWFVNVQDPITLDDSEPEPDVSLILGPETDYDARHPRPGEIALVVEVSETSLSRDRDWKKRIYARNALPVYWIVNLVDGVLEVYTDPSGPVLTPDYGTARFLNPGDTVDVVVAGTVVGTVPVADLFP
jgi:hypothetical protein